MPAASCGTNVSNQEFPSPGTSERKARYIHWKRPTWVGGTSSSKGPCHVPGEFSGVLSSIHVSSPSVPFIPLVPSGAQKPLRADPRTDVGRFGPFGQSDPDTTNGTAIVFVYIGPNKTTPTHRHIWQLSMECLGYVITSYNLLRGASGHIGHSCYIHRSVG